MMYHDTLAGVEIKIEIRWWVGENGRVTGLMEWWI